LAATDTAEHGSERVMSAEETDPDSARIIATWSNLSPIVKRMIRAGLDADGGERPRSVDSPHESEVSQ